MIDNKKNQEENQQRIGTCLCCLYIRMYQHPPYRENQYNIFIFWAKASPLTFGYMWIEFKCVYTTYRKKARKMGEERRKKKTQNCIRQRSSWKTINFLKAITSNQYTFILYLIFFSSSLSCISQLVMLVCMKIPLDFFETWREYGRVQVNFMIQCFLEMFNRLQLCFWRWWREFGDSELCYTKKCVFFMKGS
jgi:hypothetical protein